MSARIEMAGRRFGRLSVLQQAEVKGRIAHNLPWLCRCDCGAEKIVGGDKLRAGIVTCCGCSRLEKIKPQEEGQDGEIWKPIPGLPEYQASSFGRIRSINRVTHQQSKHGSLGVWSRPGRILSQQVDVHGYCRVTVRQAGRGRLPKVSRLVAAAFHGPCPDGMECCHNDGNQTNDRPENLRYDTRKNNHADKIIHGTFLCGETAPNAKLTEADVLWARSMRPRMSHKQIAKTLGVHKSCVQSIVAGRTWAHLKPQDGGR